MKNDPKSVFSHKWLSAKLRGMSVEDREKLLKKLNHREREVIKLRCGLPDGFAYTLDEVHRIFKVSITKIRRYESNAIRKLSQSGMWPGL